MGHIFLAGYPVMILEVLGVEDRQTVVDIALEAAGERQVWGFAWPEAPPKKSPASRWH